MSEGAREGADKGLLSARTRSVAFVAAEPLSAQEPWACLPSDGQASEHTHGAVCLMWRECSRHQEPSITRLPDIPGPPHPARSQRRDAELPGTVS